MAVASDYRERQAELSRRASAERREIGPLPGVENPRRKARCKKSLLAFCRTYFPRRFRLKFAACHLTTIAEMEACILRGEPLADAMPRGSGKTAIAECAVLWAILHGYQRFVVLLQATAPLAGNSFKKIKRELESNPLLAADFPEVCYPLARLERIHNRAAGQTLGGNPTNIEWTKDGVTLPTVEGSAASGAVIRVLGIESAGRGLSAMSPAGEVLRPGMVVVDDAQTRESAKSLTQTADRESIITDDVMRMVGPGESLALIMLCTVIYPGDLSDRFLDGKAHPEFRTVRIKTIETWPGRMDLWEEYAELRRQCQRDGDKRAAGAREFYRENRAAMDAGAVLSWPDRKDPGDLSALQTAMNWHFDNPRGFKAEGQNDPDPPDGLAAAKRLVPAEVAKRLSGLPRLEVPREATRLTAMVDVGARLHWYAVVGWDDRFGGSVVDAGCWPRQARTVFAADDPRPGLPDRHPGMSEEAAVYAGLSDLTAEVLGREYARQATGEAIRVERCLVDCGWAAQVVHQFCRQSPHAGVLYPSKGVGRTTTARGVSEWKPRPGERSGHHWRLTVSETGRGRMVQFDPDAWKTFLFGRLTAPLGGAGALTLWGRDDRAHELLAAHCAAESALPVTIRGATFDKWECGVPRQDNHWLDCLVGCCVAAAVQGLVWSSAAGPAPPTAPRRRVDIEQLYAQARGR